MNNPNCGTCGMLNSQGFCSLTACRFPRVNELGTWQERILANKPKPSNADRIRSMTDEELAKLIHDIVQAEMWRAQVRECITTDAGWLDWLRQEVEE